MARALPTLDLEVHLSRYARAVVAATAAAAAVLGATAASADDTTAGVTLNAGNLSLESVSAVTLAPITLSGRNQTTTGSLSIGVNDATGSGAGWSVSATSTQFKNAGGRTLPTNATTATGSPSATCASGSTCTTAQWDALPAFTLPAGATAPTAVKLLSNKAGAGMGAQTVTQGFTVAVPANTYAGSYTSTWTITLATAP